MAFQYNNTPSKMAQRVIKYSGGLIKTEEQANYVLLAFSALLFLLTVLPIFGTNKNDKVTPPPGYHIVSPEGQPSYLEKDADQ